MRRGSHGFMRLAAGHGAGSAPISSAATGLGGKRPELSHAGADRCLWERFPSATAVPKPSAVAAFGKRSHGAGKGSARSPALPTPEAGASGGGLPSWSLGTSERDTANRLCRSVGVCCPINMSAQSSAKLDRAHHIGAAGASSYCMTCGRGARLPRFSCFGIDSAFIQSIQSES